MKKKINRRRASKYIISGIVAFFLVIAIFLGTKFIPKQALGSIYNISDLSNSLDNLKVGDTINYEINGYNDWKVLSIDKENGSIDIVSNSSVEDVTLMPGQDSISYLEYLQQKADKYVDDKYAVKARCVTDADNITFNDGDFWTADVAGNGVYFKSSAGTINYSTKGGLWKSNYSSENRTKEIYILPYVEKYDANASSYQLYSDYNISINGINEWVILSRSGNYLTIIPKTPIKVEITESNVNNVLNECRSILDSFSRATNINSYGEATDRYRNYNYSYQSNYRNTIITALSEFLSDKEKNVYFYTNNAYYYYHTKNYLSINRLTYFTRNYSGNDSSISYSFSTQETKGFRPVVTLKIPVNSSSINDSESINIGDNINYEVNGYKNWRVLSINQEDNTIDIISGGIVDNILLYGKKDYEKYEEIIDNKLSNYKNGNNYISVRSVDSTDLINLQLMNDKVQSRYFLNNKVSLHGDEVSYTNPAGYNSSESYIGICFYDNNDNIIIKEWVPLHSMVNNYNRPVNEDCSYMAGIRPIITIKMDNITKLSQKESEQLLRVAEKQDKKTMQKQNKENKSANKKIITDKELNDYQKPYDESINNENDKYKVSMTLFSKSFKIFMIIESIATLILIIIGIKKFGGVINEK